MSRRFRYGADQHLRSSADFRALKDTRKRIDEASFFLKYGRCSRPDESFKGVRVAFIVGRKIGSSCSRHRIKRLARELFRLHQYEFPSSIDLLWVARRSIVPQWASLKEEFCSAIIKLRRLV